MTTPHRTLLQQALDALRQCEFTSPPAQRPIVKDAIAALREALAADHFRDVAEKVAPAAPVPDGMVMVPRKELGDGISLLHQAMVGACDCLTKTHEAKYHAESCFYRRLSEQCDKLEAAITASPAAHVVPLTDEQIRSMWKSSEFRGNGGQVDWFCEGIRAAEAHHGITGGSK